MTFTFEVLNPLFGLVSLSHSAKEGFNGRGDVELNESGSLWPPLVPLVGPSLHCPLHHQPTLQLGPAHEPNRWTINSIQKRQQRIRAKAMKIKIESLMVYCVNPN